MLKLSSGEERGGADLRKLVEEARAVRNLLDGLHSRYNRKVIEQAAIAGVLTPKVTDDPRSAKAARRLHRASASMRSPTKPSAAGPVNSTKSASISSAPCAASRKSR